MKEHLPISDEQDEDLRRADEQELQAMLVQAEKQIALHQTIPHDEVKARRGTTKRARNEAGDK